MSSIRENLVLQSRVLPAVLADQSHVRNVNCRFLLHNTALDVALGIRPCMTLDPLHAFDHDLFFRGTCR